MFNKQSKTPIKSDHLYLNCFHNSAYSIPNMKIMQNGITDPLPGLKVRNQIQSVNIK